jgi:hypothetical protein
LEEDKVLWTKNKKVQNFIPTFFPKVLPIVLESCSFHIVFKKVEVKQRPKFMKIRKEKSRSS